jgi:response regulator RpfG family c-di-GMP phosphodiesterase
MPSSAGASVRLAELLAAVSLATDLADGAPAETALTDSLVSLEFARLAGMAEETLADVYYLALLYNLGCTSASDLQASVAGGDDIRARHWYGTADYTDSTQMLRLAATRVTARRGPLARAQALVTLAMAPKSLVPDAYASICEVGAHLGERIGASPRVVEALPHAYARWDGRVLTSLPSGEAISRMARVVHIVHIGCAFYRIGGGDTADEVMRKRRGSEFDPYLADLWLQRSHELLKPLRLGSVWEAALAAEPEPQRRVTAAHVDAITGALGDFCDLKVPRMAGHSARVAALATGAAAAAGLPDDERKTLGRAAYVHDLGCVSVPNRTWEKPAGLNRMEWEQVRQHTYHTQRVLAVAEPLREIAMIAGAHHERLDGSGYHRGLMAPAIPRAARLLAAVEAFQSMVEERPWRPALSRTESAARLRDAARAGQLDRQAVDAVLGAAGEAAKGARAARAWPAGLTDREVDVLRLLARGRSNREIARELHVSEATVHTHVINVYGKIALKSRAGATLYAIENDLIQL